MANSTSKYVVLVRWQSGAVEQLEIPSTPWPGRSCPLLEVGPRDQESCATVPLYANDGPTLAEVIVHGVEIPSMLVCPAPPSKPDPCPDCGTPMVDVIPSLSRTRQSLPMCPQCHPVTCHDGTIVEPLGPFSCSGERLVPGEQIVSDGNGAFPVPVASGDDEGPTETSLPPVDDDRGSDPDLAVPVQPTPEWLAEFMAELDQRHNIRTPEGCEGAMHEAARMSDSFGFRCRSCASLARGYRACASALADARDGHENESASHHEAASRHFREAVELARQGEEVGA